MEKNLKRYQKVVIFCVLITIFLSSFVPLAEAADEWVKDSDVNFAGKIASRARDSLNWVLVNYQWAYLPHPSASGAAVDNPFNTLWKFIRNIVYAILGLFVLAAAFLMIITRGKSLTIRKFIPRFLLVLVLVTLSLSLIQFLYQMTDGFEGFFLKRTDDGHLIQDSDLLNISWDYKTFEGYRKPGAEFDESAFISTLLVKLSAVSYYAMFAVLIIRKVILWFFLAVSPIFPLLLLFAPLRNSAKIWLGEYFRWLLYAPLFAIFLAGTVALWRHNIPLNFTCLDAARKDSTGVLVEENYPVAISILLGGPCQNVTLDNSVNTTGTFIQYVVALLMLWAVIIVPFILLQIFLDYIAKFEVGESSVIKYLVNNNSALMSKYRIGGAPSTGPPSPPGPNYPSAGTGLERALPYDSPAITEVQKRMEETARETRTRMQEEGAGIARSIPAYTNTNIAENQQASSVFDASTFQPTVSSVTNQTLQNQVPTSSRTLDSVGARQATSALNQNIANIGNQASTNLSNKASSIEQSVASAQQAAMSQNINNAATANQNTVSRVVSQNTALPSTSSILNQVPTSSRTLDSVGAKMNTQNTQSSSTSNQNFTPSFTSVKNISSESGAMGIVSGAMTEILKLVNISVPTMRDVVNYETAQMGGQPAKQEEANRIVETLSRLSGASTISSPSEKQYFGQLRERLVTESKTGSPLASSILSASNTTVKAGQAIPSAGGLGSIPMVNQVQNVNIEDYEEVKKMWKDNYRKLEPPMGPDGKPKDRKTWLKEEIHKIPTVIDLLLSGDPEKVNQGKEMVSKILPFLLLGGFSLEEIVAYLKAKLQAAKEALDEVLEVEKDEENKVEVDRKPVEAPKVMQAEAPMPEEKTPVS